MSFILDALKKSEAERQRQAGPTLLSVRITPPRRRLPVWAMVVAVLLAANLIALLWFVLRKPPSRAAATAAALPPAAIITAPATTTPSAAAVAPVAAPTAAAAVQPQAPQGAAAATSAAGSVTETEDRNPADYTPAVPASAGTVKMERDLQSLPTFNEMAGSLPPLHLDLQVFSPSVPERYALINMHKVREGDVLPEGPRVIQITRDGVVLDYRGQEFILGQ